MKKHGIAVLFFVLTSSIFPQWQSLWTSPAIDYNTYSGWLSFEKDADGWKSRFYTLDTDYFKVMTSEFSYTVDYTYTFTAAEKLAGYQLYSIGYDLTGDGKTEFYVLGYEGSSSNYRQTMKVFDIVSGQVLLFKGDNNYSYSYPTFSDINGNGTLECLLSKAVYPSFGTYQYEALVTGVTGSSDKIIPLKFELRQNHPNPFNPTTTISYELDKQQTVTLRIYDTNGSLVKTLINGTQESGNHEVVWDGRNSEGIRVPTGIYFYELINQQGSSAKKMVMLK